MSNPKKAIARPTKVRVPYSPPKPTYATKGMIVFVTVLPKVDIAGNASDTSPRLFATREGAQADCDDLNKGRHPDRWFVIREMEVQP